MVLEENAVVADQGAEANPTGLKDRDQKVEQEGKTLFYENICNFSCKNSNLKFSCCYWVWNILEITVASDALNYMSVETFPNLKSLCSAWR